MFLTENVITFTVYKYQNININFGQGNINFVRFNSCHSITLMQFKIFANPNNSVSHLVFLRIVHWGGRHGHNYDGLYKQLNNDEESNGEKYESLTQ